MKRHSVRNLFGFGIFVGVVLFALMLWDYFGNDSDWFVALLFPFIVLLVILLLLLLVRIDDEDEPEAEPEVAVVTPTRAAVAEPADAPYYDFKGDIDDVIDVEGIGPVYAEKLNAMGIETTARLCYVDAQEIADSVGAPLKTVKGWQSMAELMKVKGIAGQYAEALLRGGIDGIAALKKADAAKVADDVTAYMESIETTLQGNKVTTRRVQGWQRAAATMRRVRQAVPEN